MNSQTGGNRRQEILTNGSFACVRVVRISFRRFLQVWLFAVLAASVHGAEIRFLAMDLYIDPKGQPLAAYQIEIKAPAGTKIVSVEGGEHPEFRKAPYYYPKAIQGERLIIAALSTAGGENLPTAKTRLVTLHLQTTGRETPNLQTTVKIIAQPNGQKINAAIQIRERIQP